MGELGAASPSEQGVGRRRFLLRTLSAGSVALAIPTIITVAPAGAVTSPPPQPPTDVEPATEPRPAAQPAGTQVAAASGGQLPFTGADVEKLVAGGTAAIVGGAAMIHWSAPRDPSRRPCPCPEEPPAG